VPIVSPPRHSAPKQGYLCSLSKSLIDFRKQSFLFFLKIADRRLFETWIQAYCQQEILTPVWKCRKNLIYQPGECNKRSRRNKTYRGILICSDTIHALKNAKRTYRGADKSLVRPERKQANVSVRMAWISFGALSCTKNLDNSSRLDVVEISRVPNMLPSLFPSWSG